MTPWQLTVIQWGVHMLITHVILTWRSHARTGPGHMTNHEIFAYKLFCYSLSILTYLDCDHLEHYGANAQNTYYCLRLIHTKRCYWAIILERIESQTLETHESLECLVCLVCIVCQVSQCLSWKTYTCYKKQNLKSETKLHILYAIYWKTQLPWDWSTKL